MNEKKKYSYFIRNYELPICTKRNIEMYIQNEEDCRNMYFSKEECIEKAKEEIAKKVLNDKSDCEYFVYIVELQEVGITIQKEDIKDFHYMLTTNYENKYKKIALLWDNKTFISKLENELQEFYNDKTNIVAYRIIPESLTLHKIKATIDMSVNLEVN